PLVQDRADMEERLEPSPEPAAGPAHSLGDRGQAPVARRVQMEDPIRLAVADRAQHDSLGPQRPGHVLRAPRGLLISARATGPGGAAILGSSAILSEAMAQVTLYTTEACPFCTSAKALLAKRGVAYEEINLARDPDSRARLQEKTG